MVALEILVLIVVYESLIMDVVLVAGGDFGCEGNGEADS